MTDAINPILPFAFKLVIPAEKQITYDIVDVTIPGVSVGKTTMQHQDSKVNVPDDTYEVDDISFTVILSDGFVGYRRLIEWQLAAKKHEGDFRKLITVIIFNGDMSEKAGELDYYNAWPTTIGGWTFDYTIPDAVALRVSVTLSVDGLLTVR